ncbi:uncharacterized protein N7500_007785 [Penicillium coprophilum]|uniref:uncharacterized protein n=1 Tax=Penicillium coprophilum TaxID=36646 RepID=UPI00238D8F47|nr:uncharacterized protein N7500_007785 [Penicillium coprophilum]KAJ5158134.1 hypothetical protein N7500_007785 [Penicillium coprophilum]
MCLPFPAYPPPPPNPPLSPSASGASRPIGQQLVAAPGFWALLAIVAAGCLAGASYFFWRRSASKGEDPEGIPLQDIIVARGPEETQEGIREDILAKGDVDDRPRSVATETPKTTEAPETPAAPTTPKKKTKKKRVVTPAGLANASAATRNVAHGFKEGFTAQPPVEMTSLLC